MFRIGEREHNIESGNLLILHSLEGNSFRPESEASSFRLLYITFCFDNPKNPEKIEEFNRLLRKESLPIKPAQTSDIHKIMHAVLKEHSIRSIRKGPHEKLHMGALIMEIIDMSSNESPPECIRFVTNSNTYKLINRVMVYIQENYSSDINLEQLGKLVSLHPRYLCTLFRQITGKTISEYLKQLRIEKAKRLLLYSSLSVTEIAYEVGYCNSQYFSKVFNQYEGMEPRIFRKTRKSI